MRSVPSMAPNSPRSGCRGIVPVTILASLEGQQAILLPSSTRDATLERSGNCTRVIRIAVEGFDRKARGKPGDRREVQAPAPLRDRHNLAHFSNNGIEKRTPAWMAACISCGTRLITAASSVSAAWLLVLGRVDDCPRAHLVSTFRQTLRPASGECCQVHPNVERHARDRRTRSLRLAMAASSASRSAFHGRMLISTGPIQTDSTRSGMGHVDTK